MKHTKDEALKLAREAADGLKCIARQVNELIAENKALKAALAQPAPAPTVQEPVGYVKLIDTPFGEKLKPVLTIAVPVGSKLYTTPPAAQPAPVTLADEVVGCFEAAEVEGLTAALANTTDEHLKDLEGAAS
jgi:hypothetical protein